MALNTSAKETHHVDVVNVFPQQQQQGGQHVPVTRDLSSLFLRTCCRRLRNKEN